MESIGCPVKIQKIAQDYTFTINKINTLFTPVFEHPLDAYELLKFQI